MLQIDDAPMRVPKETITFDRWKIIWSKSEKIVAHWTMFTYNQGILDFENMHVELTNC